MRLLERVLYVAAMTLLVAAVVMIVVAARGSTIDPGAANEFREDAAWAILLTLASGFCYLLSWLAKDRAVVHHEAVGLELDVPTPRPVRFRTPTLIILGLTAVISGAAPVLIVVSGLREADAWRALLNDGTETVGVVTQRQAIPTSSGRRYFVDYVYRAAGQTLKGQARSQRLYSAVAIGHRIVVVYSLQRPAISRVGRKADLDPTLPRRTQTGAALRGAGMGAVFLVSFGAYGLRLRRLRELARTGRAVVATVTSVTRVPPRIAAVSSDSPSMSWRVDVSPGAAADTAPDSRVVLLVDEASPSRATLYRTVRSVVRIVRDDTSAGLGLGPSRW
jgi:hypothetical protein